MDKKKNFFFRIEEDDHARLRVKLYYERITQTMFFNYFVKGFLEDDPLIKKFLNIKSSQRYDKKTQKKRIKDYENEQQTIKDFGLNDEEIENIFDILESENPDI